MLLVFLFTTWFLLMIVVILMARRRGRSEIGYGLSALFFSPLLPMLILGIAGNNDEDL